MRTIMTCDATSLADVLGQVSEWMAGDPPSLQVSSRMPAGEAARLLERAGARHALVVEGDDVVGAVTLRALHGHQGGQVAGCMLSTALTVRSDWPLTRAAVLLRRAAAEAIVVTDRGGRPVGLLSPDDVVRAVAGRALVTFRRPAWRTW